MEIKKHTRGWQPDSSSKDEESTSLTLVKVRTEQSQRLVPTYGTWRIKGWSLTFLGVWLIEHHPIIQWPKSAYYAWRKSILLCMKVKAAVWIREARFLTPADTGCKVYYPRWSLEVFGEIVKFHFGMEEVTYVIVMYQNLWFLKIVAIVSYMKQACRIIKLK